MDRLANYQSDIPQFSLLGGNGTCDVRLTMKKYRTPAWLETGDILVRVVVVYGSVVTSSDTI